MLCNALRIPLSGDITAEFISAELKKRGYSSDVLRVFGTAKLSPMYGVRFYKRSLASLVRLACTKEIYSSA